MSAQKKINGASFPLYESTAPEAATDVSGHEVETEMSRKPPPNGHDTDELSMTLRKLTSMLEQQTEVLTNVAGTLAAEKRTSGWKGPSGVGSIVAIILILAGALVEFIRLEDKVAFQSGSQATIEKLNDTLTRMDERQKTENLANRVNALEKASMFEYGANEQKRTGGRKGG